MKKVMIALSAAMVLTACSSDNGEERVFSGLPAEDETEVTLTFSPYQMEAMARAVVPVASPTGTTRAVTSIASIVTHLDVWIYESGSEVTAAHQTTADADFGTVSVTLDKTKTYTLYAVGHKAEGVASLENGIIAFPNEKVTHAMFYTTTFTPATATSLSCLMERIVGLFKLATTDAVPDDVAKVEFALGSTPTRWNVAGYGVNPQERTVSFNNITTFSDGTVSFLMYIIADANEATNYTITTTAYRSDNSVKQTRTFENVPIRNGYRTTYQGSFFIDTPMTMTFTVDDWQDYDTVNF